MVVKLDDKKTHDDELHCSAKPSPDRTLSNNNVEDEASHHNPNSELESVFEDILGANDSEELFELMPNLEASGVVNIFEDLPTIADGMEEVPELEETIVGGMNECDAYIERASNVQENRDIHEEIETDNINTENLAVDEVGEIIY